MKKKLKTYTMVYTWGTFSASCSFKAFNSKGLGSEFERRSLQLMCIDIAMNSGFWSESNGTASIAVEIYNRKNRRRRTMRLNVDNPYVPEVITLAVCADGVFQPRPDAMWCKVSTLVQSFGQKLFLERVDTYRKWSTVDVLHDLLTEVFNGVVPWEDRLRFKACLPLMGPPDLSEGLTADDEVVLPETVVFALVFQDDSILYITREGFTETKPKGDVDSITTKAYIGTGMVKEANAEASTRLH